ncbi:hypothetical protein AKG11_03750 [Shinella sp. SUS2]|uniref:hypothetical protein n=1 Tax=unclassified Shinella TaxID=2643062 RepID=UPI0006832090|nr:MULTISPECIES: hypothetical protein [unclassified Shinella]KNY18255.1 hypothetical protein AKG11_03750 [Shinella sp. SUS2]KOC77450.1 hypothetical protein AKG10_01220 [Shinella sp. GWS1]
MRTQGFNFPASNSERPYVQIATDCSSLELHFRSNGSGRLVVGSDLPAATSNDFVVVRAGIEPLRLTGLAAEDKVFFQPGGTGEVCITALVVDAE